MNKNEFKITREFKVPREKVFEAWTNPKLVQQWWGPANFESPFCSIDLKVGGKFHFCMRAPDGKDYWNVGEYTEIVVPEKIGSKMYFSDKDGTIRPASDYFGESNFPNEMIDLVTFESRGDDCTTLTLCRNHSEEIAEQFGELEGWNQSLDRFEKVLDHLANFDQGQCIVTLEKNTATYKKYLNAPISKTFEAWSSPDRLAQWWGPDGFSITTKTMNFSANGIWQFVMHGPDGQDYQNKIQFLEIQKPHLIFYQQLGHGEDVQEVSFQSRITFEEAGMGTNLTMTQLFPSQQELERVAVHYGAIEGGKQHLGNLAKYLSKQI